MTYRLDDVFGDEGIRTVFHAIYDISGQPSVFAYEALMRGPRGLPFEGPMLAFALAKSMDIMEELDLRCISNSLANAPRSLPIFINIHPNTMKRTDPEYILDLICGSGRSPNTVVFELIEHGAESESELLATFAVLRRAGCRLAIDDFGEGVSNLRRVLRFHPDFIKLDRWFVHGIEHDRERRIVTRTVGTMGRELEMPVIAEGITAQKQLETVKKLGIHLVQCFNFIPHGLDSTDSLETMEHSQAPSVDPQESNSPLLQQIDGFSDSHLDRLPFGVIQLSLDGTILQYNRYEEDLARFRASEVIGRNFFTDVAPCTDVRDFKGRFHDGIQAGTLHTTFRYLFPFLNRPRQVIVTLYLSTETNTVWVFVQE